MTNAFGYNLRNELTSALMQTNDYSYAYDPMGNRTNLIKNTTNRTWYTANDLNP
mgnify:CR=1 FL=1